MFVTVAALSVTLTSSANAAVSTTDSLSVVKTTVNWYNPENAGFHVIQGQAYQGQERDGFYQRFPSKAKDLVRKSVWNRSKCSAGESIVFSTDADEITVRYKVARRFAMDHMPATGVSGLDLYTYDRNGKEIYLAGNYQFKDTVTYTYSPIYIEKKPKVHRYTLYLPLYNEVQWLEIGVGVGKVFRFEPVMPSKPIVAYGTSICQGACASRPAMCWSNILQRRLGHEMINLGFSGNAMMEDEVIDLISEIDASLYILDAMPNICVLEAEAIRDTVLNAVRRLRSKRPDTPILMVDHSGHPHHLANPVMKERQNRPLEMQKMAYNTLVDEGVTGLYYLSYDELAMPQDAFVEGMHVTDYGMVAYADAYEKKLRQILHEPVGQSRTLIPLVQQRDPYLWMDRHYSILTQSAGKHYSRVLIGDSIMHFWSDTDDISSVNGQASWNDFKGESLNMGCGYDRIENVLWRIYHGQLDNCTADRIFLTIGTNNLTSGSSDEEIAEGIANLISAIRFRQPEAELVLMGIFPRRGREAQILELNKKLEKVAEIMEVKFADPGKEFLKKGKIDESLFVDGLHPNEAGYRRIASYYR